MLFRNFKFLAIGIGMLLVASALIYSVATNPPVGAALSKMKIMKGDLQALLATNKNTEILFQSERAQSGSALLLTEINQEGWGITLHQIERDFLMSRGWKEMPNHSDIFCKEGIRLRYAGSTFKGKGAVLISLSYSRETVNECK